MKPPAPRTPWRPRLLCALLLATCVVAGADAHAAARAAAEGLRQTLSLDRGWRFHSGDIPFPKIEGHGMSYANAKAGKAWGAASPDHDDSAWRELDLPHDWVIEGGFDSKANASQGYRKRGVGWYRRALKLDASDRGRHLELQFDGIATHATVWFNGVLVNRNWSGYNSVYIDITPYAQYGNQINSIVVRVDAEPMEGWWYEGGGLYRHAWLVKRDPVHIVTDGVYAHPRRGADGGWALPVEATLANMGDGAATAEIEVTLFDPAGREVAQAGTSVPVPALEQATARLSLAVSDPQLWTLEDPKLYRVSTQVKRDGKVVDGITTTAGFRYFHFDAQQGFSFNGAPLKIQGVCVHQDHAGVGVAVPDALWEFRLRKLKEMGVNAVRMAHNAPAKELLDAADRIGLLVMDENRNFNPSPDYMRQLEWLVRRDRNHPSVFLWSVFNEEPMQGTESGYRMVRRMVQAVKRLDDTRPVTAAMNDGMFSPVNVSQAVDVVGFNYQQDQYDKFHARHPDKPLISSEDTSAFITRGEYHTDMERHIMASYDDDAAWWGATHRAAWKAIDERPFVAGSFVWTGFDYHGEPTPFTWPSAGSFFGIMDLAGFPKSVYWLHQAQWRSDIDVLKLIPHWNWPGREGQPIKVMAMSNADRIVLSLNGKPISEQAVDLHEMVSWQVPYEPGRLEAVGYRNGREVARDVVETTGAPVRLDLVPDRDWLAGDGRDVQPITVRALDAEGREVPTANVPVRFRIEGGDIIGLGNGDPNSHEPEQGDRRSLFNGLAQVIVRSREGGRGALKLHASATGLAAAQTAIDLRATRAPPSVPRTRAHQQLQDWRMSPASDTAPDPAMRPSPNDMNSWAWLRSGDANEYGGAPWRLYRTQFTPHADVRRDGGRLVFKGLLGRAEVWVDGVQLGRKSGFEADEFSVALAPGEGERELTVRVQSRPGEGSGFIDVVAVESMAGTQ